MKKWSELNPEAKEAMDKMKVIFNNLQNNSIVNEKSTLGARLDCFAALRPMCNQRDLEPMDHITIEINKEGVPHLNWKTKQGEHIIAMLITQTDRYVKEE